MNTVFSFLILIAFSAAAHSEIMFKDTHGQNTPFSELKGKWVLINYWALWCATCIEEIPEFNRFYQKHQHDPVALYAVNYDMLSEREQKKIISSLHIKYPNLLHNPAKALRLGDITGVPITFVFNPKGDLVKTLYGGQTAKMLDKVIAANAAFGLK